MWLVGPLATVMFPKLVHAKAKAEKTRPAGGGAARDADPLRGRGDGLVGAGAMGGEVSCSPRHLCEADATALLPWYAWAVVPLALGNVLLNNLLAHSHFKVVPALCVLAVGYALRAHPLSRHPRHGH